MHHIAMHVQPNRQARFGADQFFVSFPMHVYTVVAWQAAAEEAYALEMRGRIVIIYPAEGRWNVQVIF